MFFGSVMRNESEQGMAVLPQRRELPLVLRNNNAILHKAIQNDATMYVPVPLTHTSSYIYNDHRPLLLVVE
jgi:hypothetical protein